MGIEPVGVSDEIREFPYLAEQLDGVPRTGPPDSPDFESILALRPDLILGLDAYLEEKKAYTRLSRIALARRCERRGLRCTDWVE